MEAECYAINGYRRLRPFLLSHAPGYFLISFSVLDFYYLYIYPLVMLLNTLVLVLETLALNLLGSNMIEVSGGSQSLYTRRPRGPKPLNPTAPSMFEKQVKEEKIYEWTCSHPIYARTLIGVCQAVRMFSSHIFQVSISIGTFVSIYDWGVWRKAELVYQ